MSIRYRDTGDEGGGGMERMEARLEEIRVRQIATEKRMDELLAILGTLDEKREALEARLIEAFEERLARLPRGPGGRPRIEGPRPWDEEGISRRTWYRRKRNNNNNG